MIGRVNTGGGTGGTLTVTTPGAGIAVTVAKDGKTKARASGADGTAVFKGLEGGDWVLTMTDGSQTAQKTVAVTTDYAVALTFFAATINVTYPAGSTCTATDGVTILTAPDTGGTWACVVPNAGTWTVTATDGTKSKSADAAIETDGQTESVELMYRTYLFQEGIGSLAEFYKTAWGGNTVTIDGNAISLKGTESQGGVFTSDAVDLSNYKTIYFDSKLVKNDSRADYGVRFGAFSAKELSNPASNNNVSVNFPGSTTAARTVYSVDVSSINEQYYIGAKGVGTVTIYNIWLE